MGSSIMVVKYKYGNVKTTHLITENIRRSTMEQYKHFIHRNLKKEHIKKDCSYVAV